MNPNKALWEKGDFTRIAASMRESGEDHRGRGSEGEDLVREGHLLSTFPALRRSSSANSEPTTGRP